MDENANRQFTAGQEHRHQHRDEVNRLMHRLTSAAEQALSDGARLQRIGSKDSGSVEIRAELLCQRDVSTTKSTSTS
jgi:uncharacterized protein YfcZ (UPF0381/DUF406 family)